jgi:hypothetical protein
MEIDRSPDEATRDIVPSEYSVNPSGGSSWPTSTDRRHSLQAIVQGDYPTRGDSDRSTLDED